MAASCPAPPRSSVKGNWRRGSLKWRGRAAVAGGMVGLVSCLLLVAPLAGATTLGVTLKKPYSGTAALSGYSGNSGIGCPGTGNDVFTPPYFSVSHGRGGLGQFSDSQPCSAWVLELHDQTSNFGFNSSAITPSASVKHDVVRFHWTFTFSVYLQTVWGGGSQVTYASAEILVGAWVVDLTAGGGVGAKNSYYNFSDLYDQSSTMSFSTYQVHSTIEVDVALNATHTYSLETSVEVETTAETEGPVTSTASDTAYAQVTFPGSGPSAILNSITY
jgi:hypothetical protein